MEIDLLGHDANRAYKLLASAVVPRPIALVTTQDRQGRVNAAPFSFFNLMGSQPPILAINIADLLDGSPKHTRANIAATKEFVVNLVHRDIAESMNVCAIDFPGGANELDFAKFTPASSTKVAPPRIAESRVQIECTLAEVVNVGNNHVVIGNIVYLHVADEFLDKERMRVRTPELDLIGRMHGSGWYARTTDLFEIPRILFSEWNMKENDRAKSNGE
ncbi:MAG: flavin reductase family protein [Capsulimonadaceae bacterium]|nr:flavin reductase family protein [Capsulimonadaceae bacterium]